MENQQETKLYIEYKSRILRDYTWGMYIYKVIYKKHIVKYNAIALVS